MKKNIFRNIILTFILLSTTFALSACAPKDSVGDNIESTVLKESAPALSELQIAACNAAHDGGTCNTKLEDLGVVNKAECCSQLYKCC